MLLPANPVVACCPGPGLWKLTRANTHPVGRTPPTLPLGKGREKSCPPPKECWGRGRNAGVATIDLPFGLYRISATPTSYNGFPDFGQRISSFLTKPGTIVPRSEELYADLIPETSPASAG